MSRFYFAVIAVLLSVPAESHADVFEIAPGESIVDVIAVAADGDVLQLSEGTYRGPVDFLGKALTLRGAPGVGRTVIDGTGTDKPVIRCASGEGRDTVIAHVTLTGGSGDDASGIARGGGLYVVDSEPTVVSVLFEGNHADVGGALYVSYAGAPLFVNVCFYDNKSSANGGACFFRDCEPVLVNCTVASNVAGNLGGIVVHPDASMTMTGCIVWGNSDSKGDGPASQVRDLGASSVIEYSCIAGGWSGIGNIAENPHFVGGWMLPAHSPCVDMAVVPADIVPRDITGQARLVDQPHVQTVVGAANLVLDMGCHEVQIDDGKD